MIYKITVTAPGSKTVISAAQNAVLADVLCENGFAVPAACGRRGICNKCTVKVLNGFFNGDTPDENGMIRSCKAKIASDAEISLDFVNGTGLTDLSSKTKAAKNACGIAVDIGTTTVAATYLKKDGSTKSVSRLNPQSAYGADVISRIEACSDGKTDILCALIRRCIKEMVLTLCGEQQPDEMVVSGNATMLHLFCSVSPVSMGVYPFEPVFTSTRIYSGKEMGIPVKKITVLPGISAFVGSDIVSGIYALSLHKTNNRAFLADLGTNGELVLTDRGRLYCTSAAAGPALEGACMECGTGGVAGAIDSVYDENGKIRFTVIENKSPSGICGAGIVDTVSLMLEKGLIDETGATENERFYICDDIYISQSDIRQFQLAKSAICSGIETLIQTVGLCENDIDDFYIAGGLGYYMNAESAFNCGILPRMACRVHPAGNTSLSGALMCIGSESTVRDMEKIAESCTHIDLGGNPSFNERFMNHMFF
ncbi:MAG: ASKHA domain-containing protein [Clostridia bacterium]|nr:ASKHA domain-containing protein [Clostridia bacterium]